MRIDPEDIKAAYRLTGLKPIDNCWLSIEDIQDWPYQEAVFQDYSKGIQKGKFQGKACALSALSIAKSITSRFFSFEAMMDGLEDEAMDYLGLPEPFFLGFLHGFDANLTCGYTGQDYPSDEILALYQEGFANGVEIRLAILTPETK